MAPSKSGTVSPAMCRENVSILAGWHIMQGHRWGSRSHDHSAWGSVQRLGRRPQGQLLRGVQRRYPPWRPGPTRRPSGAPGARQRSVSLRHMAQPLRHPHPLQPYRLGPLRCRGPMGASRATVKAAPAQTVASSGRALEKPVHRFVNLMAEITPRAYSHPRGTADFAQ